MRTINPQPNTPAQPLPSMGDTKVNATIPQPVMAEVATEFGGRDGLEPTRYGDWEKAGRCIDF